VKIRRATKRSSMQRRNRRGGVEDRWRRADGKPTTRAGKGKRWLARYVDEQGRENSRSFDRRVDAQAWLDEITAAHVTGTYVAPKAGLITISELYVKWAGTQGHLKATTIATRTFTWSAHVAPRWSTVAVADLRTSDIRSWVQEMTGAGLGAATIENALSVLRQILEMAVDDRRIPRNPCVGVKAPRRQHRSRGYLTHEQVESLARAVEESFVVEATTDEGLTAKLLSDVAMAARSATVVRFLAYTGLRWGEMAALRVDAMDMLRRRVHIRQATAEVGGKVVWSSPKSHERRSVPFPAFLANELAAVMVGKGRDELVFTSSAGGVLRVSTWRPRVFAQAVLAAKAAANARRAQEFADTGSATTPEFPAVSPHDLRHTAASLAISAGANVKSVQTMLGHASAVLTLDTYADLFPDDLEMVSAALDDARPGARIYCGPAADWHRKGPDQNDQSGASHLH
jgi:integrase